MTGFLINGGNLDTEADRHTGRMPCEGEGRDRCDASTSQGTPKIASKPPEVRGEAWNRCFLIAFRRDLPCQYLDI